MTRIVYNPMLRGWYIVRGPHQAPIGGRFNSREEALAWMGRDVAAEYRRRYSKGAVR